MLLHFFSEQFIFKDLHMIFNFLNVIFLSVSPWIAALFAFAYFDYV